MNDEIPQEIVEAALEAAKAERGRRIADQQLSAPRNEHAAMRAALAAARPMMVEAEREACAKIADEKALYARRAPLKVAAADIASRIRARKEAP